MSEPAAEQTGTAEHALPILKAQVLGGGLVATCLLLMLPDFSSGDRLLQVAKLALIGFVMSAPLSLLLGLVQRKAYRTTGGYGIAPMAAVSLSVSASVAILAWLLGPRIRHAFELGMFTAGGLLISSLGAIFAGSTVVQSARKRVAAATGGGTNLAPDA